MMTSVPWYLRTDTYPFSESSRTVRAFAEALPLIPWALTYLVLLAQPIPTTTV